MRRSPGRDQRLVQPPCRLRLEDRRRRVQRPFGPLSHLASRSPRAPPARSSRGSATPPESQLGRHLGARQGVGGRGVDQGELELAARGPGESSSVRPRWALRSWIGRQARDWTGMSSPSSLLTDGPSLALTTVGFHGAELDQFPQQFDEVELGAAEVELVGVNQNPEPLGIRRRGRKARPAGGAGGRFRRA